MIDSYLLLTCALGILCRVTAFPENLKPLTAIENASGSVFVGDNETNLLHLQDMKELYFGSVRRIAVAAKEKLYLLDPDHFSALLHKKTIKYTEVFSWKSNSKTRALCLMKGQPENLCYNFLSTLHVTNNGDLLICGTNSYSPQCSLHEVSIKNNKVVLRIKGKTWSGRNISPFGPNQSRASLFTAGSFFSGSYQSIFGGSPMITRTMGEIQALRSDTSQYVMQEAEFVKFTEDEQRVLIFFNEQEILPTGERRTVSQVAQVCKNDPGGHRILEGKFTTFVKSRLNCSYNGFYLNQLRYVTDPIVVGNQKVVFAAFSTPDNFLPGSAICAFKLSLIQSSLSGPFLVNRDLSENILNHVIPASKHPGNCQRENLKDDDLVFLKNHPQLKQQTSGSLLLTNQGQRWTAVAVDATAGPNNVTVIYIGTRDGRLIRSLPPLDGSSLMSAVVISDVAVYDKTRCSNLQYPSSKAVYEDKQVKSILIQEDVVLVAFKHCVISLPLKMCSRYQCGSACLASSDPYCGWNGSSCVPFLHPHQDIEQNLRQSIFVPLCSDDVQVEEEIKSKDDEELVTVGTSLNQSLDVEGRSESEVGSALESSYKYPLMTLIFVAVSTFIVTLLVITTIFCCCSRSKHADDLKHKQFKQQHDMVTKSDDRSGSFKRRVIKTYCGWNYFFRKVTTPLQSPDVRRETCQKRHRNNYSEAPTRKPRFQIEKQTLKTSSRMSSISSDTSRCDGIGFSPQEQPLIACESPVKHPVADETLPKHISEQSTLPFHSKPTGDTPSDSSCSQSSGSSLVFPENGSGAAEVGVLLTRSAKLRRRDKQVKERTNEIMRDSDSAIQQTESVLLRIEKEQQSGVLSPSLLHMRPSLTRDRIDSHDSGRGDSCRSSMKPESEQTFINSGPGPQRPSSLNFQKNILGTRRRLQSEGSYHSDVMVETENVFVGQRKRRVSGNHSNSSQCGTPVTDQYCIITSPKNQFVSPPTMYGTWSKADMTINGKEKAFQQLHELAMKQSLYNLNQKYPNQSTRQRLPSTDFSLTVGSLQRGLHTKRFSAESPLLSSSFTSPSKRQTVNYYPSLQVRGAHAQKTLHVPQQHIKQINCRTRSPPQNYYSPMRPQSNFHAATNTCEGQGLVQSRKKPTLSLARHASMPATAKPVVCVAPIMASHGGAVQ